MPFQNLPFYPKKRNSILLLIFTSAFILKLLIFYLVTDPILFNKYPFFAERISNGLNIGERVLDLSPVYLYAHALLYKIYGNNWEAMLVLQIFLGSLNCLFIYYIGEKVFGKAVGLVAAFLLLLYGNLTLLELTLEPECFLLFINSLLILVVVKGPPETESGKWPWRWLGAGVLAGLAIITKPNALLLLPVLLIWIWQESFSLSARMKSALLLLIGASLLVSPITLRNYVQFKDFVLVTADGGKVFFHGNGPGSTGMERADLPDQGFTEEGSAEPDYAHVLFRKAARAQTGQILKPSECARFWFVQTLNYMRAHPFSAFFLELKKFFYFWGNYEVHDIDSTYKNYRTIQSWPLLPFGVISALGIMGMVLALKKFRQAFLLYAMVLIYLFSVLVFFAASRYRLPASPFLSIFAAYALTVLFTQLRQKQMRKFFLCSAITIGLFLGTYFFGHKEIEILERWQTATRIHYSLGGNFLFKKRLYLEAIQEYEKAVALEPDFAPAYNRLGMSYAILNKYPQAENNFQKVIELSPGIDQGYLNLGLLYELEGNLPKALPLLEKAFALNPQNSKTREHLEKISAKIGQGSVF